jgi:uncharacterized cofD-like protein
LVKGIPKAIRQSPARKAYLMNLMWQPGETMHYGASDHVKAIYRHAAPGLIDTVVVNTRPLTGEMRRRYAASKVFPVVVDHPELEAMGLRVEGHNLLAPGSKVRHSPEAAAAVVVALAQEGRARRAKAGRPVWRVERPEQVYA